MRRPGPRIEREQRTIRAMVDLYCRDHHPPDGWHRCAGCEEFLAYAHQRLEKCPFQEAKPVCNDCSIHCYKPGRRAQAKAIMRHSGPWMILYHPLHALRHLLEARRERLRQPGSARHQSSDGAPA